VRVRMSMRYFGRANIYRWVEGRLGRNHRMSQAMIHNERHGGERNSDVFDLFFIWRTNHDMHRHDSVFSSPKIPLASIIVVL
jgi:hypothetical protein